MLNDLFVGANEALLQVQAQTSSSNNGDVWSGWGSVLFVLTVIVIVALVASLLIWQMFRTRQTKMLSDARVAEANAYRQLAEEAAAVQTQTASELASLNQTITDLRTRVTSIERILAEVG